MSLFASRLTMSLCSFAIAASAFAIDAPVATEATSRTANGFTATWEAVTGATSYKFDLFRVGEAVSQSATEGFDDLANGLPDGWEASEGYEACTTSGYYNNSPSIRIGNDGNYVTTCEYLGVVTNFSFMSKGSAKTSTATIKGFSVSSGDWIVLVAADPVGTKTTRTFDIDPSLKINRIRFIFNRVGGTFAIDDVKAIYSHTTLEPVISDYDVGNGTAYPVTGLAPATYRYVVRATDGADNSANSNAIDVEVTGVNPQEEAPDAPVALAATGMSATGFTANWTPSDGATGYTIDLDLINSTPARRVTEDFNSFAGSADTIPDGWAMGGTLGCYTTGHDSPNSVKLAADTIVISPEYAESVTNVTYWIKGNSAGTSTVILKALPYGKDMSDAEAWKTLREDPVSGSYSLISVDLDRSDNYRQFRITFNRDKGYVALDDFSAAFGGPYLIPVQTGVAVAGGDTSSHAFTGLSVGEYQYTVKALNGPAASKPSNAIQVTVGNPPHSAPVIEPFESGLVVRIGDSVEVPVVIAQEDGDEIFATNVVASTSGWTLENGVFAYIPTSDDIGTQTFTFTAKSFDRGEERESLPVTLTLTVKREMVFAISMADCRRCTYTNDFDCLGNGSEWDDMAYPLPGWRATVSGNPPAATLSGTGSSGTSGLYSFGSDSDRSLGSLASSAIYYGAAFTNNTGKTIYRIDISYVGKQFRVGQSNDDVNTLDFAWCKVAAGQTVPAINSTSKGLWTTVDDLSYDTTETTQTLGKSGVVEPAAQTPIAYGFSVRLEPGDIFMIRWHDGNDDGYDHAMGIDNLGVRWSFNPATIFMIR